MNALVMIRLPIKHVSQYPLADDHDLAHWACTTTVTIDEADFVSEATGENALQAILMAIEFARGVLDDSAHHWIGEDEVPHWMIFPRSVPIAWGGKFYGEICALIDQKQDDLNRMIESRRPPDEE